MHGIKENSNTLRVIWFLMNGMFLLIAYLICFDEKFIWFDSILNLDFKNGNFYRKCCLMIFGAIMYIRMYLTTFHLLKRRIQIDEFFGVLIAYFIYQIGFILLGAWNTSSLGTLDYFGILFFFRQLYKYLF